MIPRYQLDTLLRLTDKTCGESEWGPEDDLKWNAFKKSFEDTDEL